MNDVKWATIKNLQGHYSWYLRSDTKLSTLALVFADGFHFVEGMKKKLIAQSEIKSAGGNLLFFYIINNLVYLEPQYWGDDDADEDVPNTCQIIILRDVLLKIIDEGLRWMKKGVPRIVFMHYKNHYFIADRVLIEDELDAILQNSDSKEIVAIKDH